jgi:hypothetical protein
MESQTGYIHHRKGTVRPYIYGRLDLLDFVKKVFNAIELERNKLPNGFHVQAQIGDSVTVLSAMDPPYQEATGVLSTSTCPVLTRPISARSRRVQPQSTNPPINPGKADPPA